MKVRLAVLLAVASLACSVSFAQNSPKIEITGDYSYFRLNPGLPSVWNSQNLNGGGAQAALYLKSWLAVAADFQGYGSFTQCPKSSSEFSGCASGNLFTYTFGPQVKYRAGKFEPCAEVLLGGAQTNFYANACNKNTGICGSKSPTNNAFALAIGGGVDIAVLKPELNAGLEAEVTKDRHRPVKSPTKLQDSGDPPLPRVLQKR